MTEPQHNLDEVCRLLWAMREDELAPKDAERLRSMLIEYPHARELYVYYMFLSGSLEWDSSARAKDCAVAVRTSEKCGDSGFGIRGSENAVKAAGEHPVGAAVELPSGPEPRTPNPESPFPVLSTTHYPLPTTPFVGSWAFSCMVATVIMGVMLLVFWAIKVPHHQHIAEAPSKSVPSDARPEMVFVGRITGMVDVKWSDDPHYLPPPGFAYVSLGRKYILSSGLLEITYDSGAKVILEGPCTYKVESTAGGYLALGKLTARVGERGEGRGESAKPQAANQKSEIRNQKSPSSFILHPSSLFSVRTPTAVITDLGTEFGVEVGKSGVSQTHVFKGKVEVRVAGGDRGGRVISLGENESARVERGKDRVITVTREEIRSNAFTRQMPRRVRIKLFNTGMEVNKGEEDPHWQLVAVSNDPNFKPRPALVSRIDIRYLANKPARSQWISAVDDTSPLPDDVTYTFRTTFDLAGTLPKTAILRGRLLADDGVSAMRLNGRDLVGLDLRERPRDSSSIPWRAFEAVSGFVEGANVLEVDVWNKVLSNSRFPRPLPPTTFCMELEGSVMLAPATATDNTLRKTAGARTELSPQQGKGAEPMEH